MNSLSGGWSLHPQLERDTHLAGDLTLSRVLVMNDARYPWLILVPRQAGAVELVDLEDGVQLQLMREIARSSTALRRIAACDKLNVAALGNMMPQLHIHIIARTRTDAAWPKPVWGAFPAIPYEASDMQRLVRDVRQALEME